MGAPSHNLTSTQSEELLRLDKYPARPKFCHELLKRDSYLVELEKFGLGRTEERNMTDSPGPPSPSREVSKCSESGVL